MVGLRILFQVDWGRASGSLRVPPHTHAIPHHALDHTNVVGPPWCVVRYSHQRAFPRTAIRSYHHAVRVVRYLLARPLEQLRVYGGWERPRWAARGSGFVRGELETDEHAVLCEERGDTLRPGRAQVGRQRAEELWFKSALILLND